MMTQTTGWRSPKASSSILLLFASTQGPVSLQYIACFKAYTFPACYLICRISSFEEALGLLRAQYPSKSSSVTGHLYTKWTQCNTWHHHILALRARYDSMKEIQAFVTRDPSYVELIRDDAW